MMREQDGREGGADQPLGRASKAPPLGRNGRSAIATTISKLQGSVLRLVVDYQGGLMSTYSAQIAREP
jgi:hypothetical protein